eukprot:765043-Hanusia_phi.AAC.7
MALSEERCGPRACPLTSAEIESFPFLSGLDPTPPSLSPPLLLFSPSSLPANTHRRLHVIPVSPSSILFLSSWEVKKISKIVGRDGEEGKRDRKSDGQVPAAA